MRSFIVAVCGCITATLCLGTRCIADEPTWKAGAASVAVTPSQSMWMAGYASRKEPSNGTATELFVKALAIEDQEGKRAILVTSDLISIPRELRAQVAQACQEKYEIDPAGLLLNCSHTHSGPVVRDRVETSVLYAVDDVHRERIELYFVELRDKIVAAIGQAIEKLEPAKLSTSHARCGFAMNRRLPTATGFQNSPYPDGPVDHEVPVLRVESSDGKMRAVLFGYACHNTTLSGLQFDADYAGYAQTELEKAHPGVVALFMMGCGGDQNPYPRGKTELAQTHGKTLATAVEAALLPAAKPISGSLRYAYREIDLPFAPLSRDEILQRMKSNDTYEKRRAESLLREFDEQGHVRESYPYPVQVLQVGDQLTMVTLGGEVVIDYALRLKQELIGSFSKEQRDKATVWVAGYSNDVMAYIPSERVLAEGGYEGGGAMRYSSLPNTWRPGIEERIVGTVHQLIKDVK